MTKILASRLDVFYSSIYEYDIKSICWIDSYIGYTHTHIGTHTSVHNQIKREWEAKLQTRKLASKMKWKKTNENVCVSVFARSHRMYIAIHPTAWTVLVNVHIYMPSAFICTCIIHATEYSYLESTLTRKFIELRMNVYNEHAAVRRQSQFARILFCYYYYICVRAVRGMHYSICNTTAMT